jgi:uncharacterized membrane protein
MKKIIAVIDGLGGGIGAELVSRLKDIKETEAKAEIIALGSNAIAAQRMMNAGAARGASGENAISVSVRGADIVLGPIGIVIGNSMMGEITQAIAGAVLSAPGKRILLPLQNEHFVRAGMESVPLSRMIEKAVEVVRRELDG